MGTRSLFHLHTTIFFFFFFFFSFFFFLGKLYHYLHTTTDRSLDPPSSFFLGKLYHHQSELRSTIFSILPDSTVGTIISVLDPLISKIKKQTFQFKQYPQTFQFKESPKSLTHYSVFLSLFHFQIFHQWCRSSLIGFFMGKRRENHRKMKGEKQGKNEEKSRENQKGE